jgi:hypothetical protein
MKNLTWKENNLIYIKSNKERIEFDVVKNNKIKACECYVNFVSNLYKYKGVKYLFSVNVDITKKAVENVINKMGKTGIEGENYFRGIDFYLENAAESKYYKRDAKENRDTFVTLNNLKKNNGTVKEYSHDISFKTIRFGLWSDLKGKYYLGIHERFRNVETVEDYNTIWTSSYKMQQADAVNAIKNVIENLSERGEVYLKNNVIINSLLREIENVKKDEINEKSGQMECTRYDVLQNSDFSEMIGNITSVKHLQTIKLRYKGREISLNKLRYRNKNGNNVYVLERKERNMSYVWQFKNDFNEKDAKMFFEQFDAKNHSSVFNVDKKKNKNLD